MLKQYLKNVVVIFLLTLLFTLIALTATAATLYLGPRSCTPELPVEPVITPEASMQPQPVITPVEYEASNPATPEPEPIQES